jgi:hypothetical protein
MSVGAAVDGPDAGDGAGKAACGGLGWDEAVVRCLLAAANTQAGMAMLLQRCGTAFLLKCAHHLHAHTAPTAATPTTLQPSSTSTSTGLPTQTTTTTSSLAPTQTTAAAAAAMSTNTRPRLAPPTILPTSNAWHAAAAHETVSYGRRVVQFAGTAAGVRCFITLTLTLTLSTPYP